MKMLVDIDVPDISRAIDFYSAAFDLRLTRMLDKDVAELVGGSSVIYLLEKEEASKAASNSDARRDYGRHWTPVHIDFVVDDIERATQRVLAAGAKRESQCIGWRGSRCVTFSDPFGNGFCVITFDDETYSTPSPAP